ncbi:MAG: chromate resistance protein ChrB domain-containing protein [Planctomycetia bacterium]
MMWVTWENVGVDRIGCAWLILREIDPQAQFRFIPAGSPIPENTEPFDIPGVKYSHHDGHSSFYALVKQHHLQDSVLHRIARVIDEADTIQAASVEPAAPGLDVICEGLRLVTGDDLTAIERGRMVYDALYARLSLEQ